jgi:hypothetical protein
MLETIILIGGLVGLAKGISVRLSGGGGVARTPDECDAHERQFLLANKRDTDPSGMRRYLDHKRHALGFQRRPGVNADLLAPRNDDWWTTKPGE